MMAHSDSGAFAQAVLFGVVIGMIVGLVLLLREPERRRRVLRSMEFWMLAVLALAILGLIETWVMLA